MKHIRTVFPAILTLSLLLGSASVFSQQKTFLAAVRTGGKWGYVNTKGEMVIPCQYEEAKKFHEGLAAVSVNKKDSLGLTHPAWGYINKKGEFVIPAKYSNAADFHEGFAAVYANGQWAYINKRGIEKIRESDLGLPMQASAFYDFQDGRGSISLYETTDSYSVDSTGKATKSGMLVSSSSDDEEGQDTTLWIIGAETEGSQYDAKSTIVAKDNNGKKIFEIKCAYARNFYEGLAYCETLCENPTIGFIDKTGKFVITKLAQGSTGNFHKGFAWSKCPDEKYGYINTKGEPAIPQKFEAAKDFSAAD